MKDPDCVAFLQWALPRLQMRWPGIRKVRKQVCKRIDRRLVELGLADIEAYRDRLEIDPDEWSILDGFCRIPISRFCRDRAVFEFIRDEALPARATAAEARGDRTLHGWSAGCASGEEVYTLAMIWKLVVGPRFPSLSLHLIATDSDPAMIERARRARYSWSSIRELPEEWRAAFTRTGESLQLAPEFRDGVEPVLQDIRQAMPRESFDLILCRNLAFTYFDEPLQCRILDGLVARLLPGGFLVIGQRESLPRAPDDLEPVRRGLGAYRRI